MSANPSDHEVRHSSCPIDLPCDNLTLANEIRDVKDMVNKIHLALVGDPKLGYNGVIPRLNRVESKVEAHDRKLLVWGSFIVGASIILAFIKDAILTRLGFK